MGFEFIVAALYTALRRATGVIWTMRSASAAFQQQSREEQRD